MILKVFALEPNKEYYIKQFLINCHKCGKSIVSDWAKIYVTDIKDYFLDTYCRLIIITAIDEFAYNNLCECHLEKIEKVMSGEGCWSCWLYDKQDIMIGKKLEDVSKD